MVGMRREPFPGAGMLGVWLFPPSPVSQGGTGGSRGALPELGHGLDVPVCAGRPAWAVCLWSLGG